MACRSCVKNVEKTTREKVGFQENVSHEECVKAWLSLYSKAFESLSVYNVAAISNNFNKEIGELSRNFDLVHYFKRIAPNNRVVINILCAMAYSGFLKTQDKDDILYLAQDDGSTIAHWLALSGRLDIPYDSYVWRIGNKYSETPAHWAARAGKLDAPHDSDLWGIYDTNGWTPAYWAVMRGRLDVSNDYYLWRIPNRNGETPAHWAAQQGLLNVPYESDLWRIKDNIGRTPAHCFAEIGALCDSYESDLWRIPDNNGFTPAHLLAMNGKLKAPYTSDLWLIPNNAGETPAHWIALLGKLNAPYDSIVWSIPNRNGDTPAHWGAINSEQHPPYDSNLWRLPNNNLETPAHFAAQVGSLDAPPDSSLWYIQNVFGNTPAHESLRSGYRISVPYKSSLWFVANNNNITPLDLIDDRLMILLHHSEKNIQKYLSGKKNDLKQCQTTWDVLGYIRVSLLINDYSDFIENPIYQSVEEINPHYPELCDFSLILKNVTQPWLLTHVVSDSNLCYAYCHAMAGSITYLLRNNQPVITEILFRNTCAYVKDSIFLRLSEHGLWENMIAHIMLEKYGVSIG